MRLTPIALKNAIKGRDYTEMVKVTGGKMPYVVSGLPAGMTNHSNGNNIQISGRCAGNKLAERFLLLTR